jgi:signal transduction histidine kinase/ActR/RegA family two-component response regulator
MNVRTKIIVLLFMVVAVFVAGLIAIKWHDAREFRLINEERARERTASFEKFREHWSASLETLVNEFATTNDAVRALQQGDQEWAASDLNHDKLVSFRTHFVWLYDAEAALFFTRNVRYTDEISQVPIPPGAVAKLLQERRLTHYFAKTPLGIMEIQGASVHPSIDAARQLPAAGYLFAARLWTAEDLKEIALLTGYKVALVDPSHKIQQPEEESTGTVQFLRPMEGWDGDPVAALLVTSESPAVKKLISSSERAFLWMMAFAVVLFLLLSISLTKWVAKPLRSLAKGLKRQKMEPLEGLKNDTGEFGDLARLVGAFFQQREKLLHEMEERRQTQEALQLSEEQLRHSQKMEAVGRLAGGIAHDFNNLLTAIIGYANLLQQRLHRDPASAQYAELIGKAGDQAAALTRQLLAFSRKQLLQPRVVDLNALVLEMEKLLQRVIGEHIRLSVDLAAEPGRVRADPTQLEQVIVNLGVNARDAMPRGGELTLRTSNIERITTDGVDLPPGRYVALSVSDNGCGMDAETKERIFEPFFTTKEAGKGTGLGLATVYGIVRQTGGAISVESTPGAGTIFTIFLPHEAGPVEAQQLLQPPVARTEDGETLLIVEDEEIVRELVCAVLTEKGYNVLCAENGGRGLKAAADYRGTIDLLITDVIMPDMNGPELARRLHESRPETRVLFVSGYSDNDIADHGELPTDIHFLEKPFTPETLSRKVQSVLHDERAAELQHLN